MTSRRRSSVGGFHPQITVHKSKVKGYEIDTINVKKFKEEPRVNPEPLQKDEEKDCGKSKKSNTVKSIENTLPKKAVTNVTSNTIQRQNINKLGEEMQFGNNGCIEDILNDSEDFTSDVPYQDNFERAPLAENKIKKKIDTSHKINKRISGSCFKNSSKITEKELKTSDKFKYEKNIAVKQVTEYKPDSVASKSKGNKVNHSTNNSLKYSKNTETFTSAENNVLPEVRRSDRIAKLSKISYKEVSLISKLRA